eukprot:314045-Chlamydomonas_euryale.AAC.1
MAADSARIASDRLRICPPVSPIGCGSLCVLGVACAQRCSNSCATDPSLRQGCREAWAPALSYSVPFGGQ